MKKVQQEKQQRIQLFHNHLIQVALDRDSYEDSDLVHVTAQPQSSIRWNELTLRQRVAVC